MKKKLWHKRIPTLAALGLLLIGLWVTSLLIQTGVVYVGRAGPNKVPQNISVSNITNSSFTVSFATNEKTLSGLSVKEAASSPFLVYDDRNKLTNQQDEFYSHFITVADLKPNTNYTFSILADGETYLDDEKEYSITTGPPIVGNPPIQNPIVGNILLTDGSPGDDVIVELSIGGAQKIAVLTKPDGEYIIPTNSIRDSSLNDYYELPLEQEITITAKRQGSISTVKSLFAASTKIPVITLEESYDFSLVTREEVASLSSQLQIPTPRIGIGEVRITTPRENQTFIDTRPLFRGTAIARQNVRISYDTVNTQTVSDGNGIWTYRPETDIPPGEHSLTIESSDRFGIIKSVTQEFTVFSSGSQVAQSATPSATLTPTSVPTQTPTIAPTATPTIIPTSALTPTTAISPTISPSPSIEATPSILPTDTIAPTKPVATSTLIPSPTNAVQISPPAPGSTSAVVLTVVSVVLIFAGGALLFLL